MAEIGKECSSCGEYYRRDVTGNTAVICPHCRMEEGTIPEASWTFARCPFCDCKHFYRRKDFNQFLGCLIVLAGAALVPFTYGISLAVVVAIDWLLYRKVPEIGVCYRCGAEFREFGPLPDSMTSFNHHTAELYETN